MTIKVLGFRGSKVDSLVKSLRRSFLVIPVNLLT